MLNVLLFAAAAVAQWSQPPIASNQFESHPAFDPKTGDLWFVRSSPRFEGWRIKVSHCRAGGWSEPEDAPFAGDGVEADPFFTNGGRTLYFISTRSTDGIKRPDLDIWRVDRDAKGKWGTPQRLPEPVNSGGKEWFPRFGPDGWLYFGSDRPGGQGKTDIWRAKQGSDGRWTVENAGPAINSAADEYEPLFSPDGKTMLINANDGYYQSKRTATGWAPRTRMGPEINANGTEVGALFSPSGKSLLFARDAGAGKSGELFVAHWGGESWPPACGSAKTK